MEQKIDKEGGHTFMIDRCLIDKSDEGVGPLFKVESNKDIDDYNGDLIDDPDRRRG